MGLLSEIERQARKQLERARHEHATAGPMRKWRLNCVIRERERQVQMLEHIKRAILLGMITRADLIKTKQEEADHG